MLITFHKRSDSEHVLEIVREDGQRERLRCETRSYLTHDLLHYALETEAQLDGGVWGRLAAGATLSLLNDQARDPDDSDQTLSMVETLVGGTTAVLHGELPRAIVERLQKNADALDWPIPTWFTPEFVAAVAERMRRLRGHWRATPFGRTMTLPWPPEP